MAVGIILHDNRVLVTRRADGSHLARTWEFPGGGIQPGESPEDGLRRELQEELGIAVEKATLIHRQFHVYSDREVELYFFLCTRVTGEARGAEGQEVRWVSAGDLQHLETPAANEDVIRMLKDQLS